MKILYVGYHLEKLVESCRYYFWNYMIKNYDVIHLGFNNPISRIFNTNTIIDRGLSYIIFQDNVLIPEIDVRRIRKMCAKEKPDVLVFEDRLMYHLSSADISNLNINIPKVLILNDVHHVDKHSKYIGEFCDINDVRLCLSKMKYCIDSYKKYINCPVEWFPWSVDTSVFHNYGENKEYDVFSSGIISHFYPFRSVIQSIEDNHHLGYKDINFYYEKYPIVPMFGKININNIKENYARKLSKSKIFLFGNSELYFPIQKYFEGMASDCLVIAPTPNDWESLGFCTGVNFIHVSHEFNVKDLVETIEYWLDNPERGEIIKRANKLMKEKHDVSIRAKEFMKSVEKVI